MLSSHQTPFRRLRPLQTLFLRLLARNLTVVGVNLHFERERVVQQVEDPFSMVRGVVVTKPELSKRREEGGEGKTEKVARSDLEVVANLELLALGKALEKGVDLIVVALLVGAPVFDNEKKADFLNEVFEAGADLEEGDELVETAASDHADIAESLRPSEGEERLRDESKGVDLAIRQVDEFADVLQ
jgi:hypothetical protein